MIDIPITLGDILLARGKRGDRLSQLLKQYEKPVVLVTMNIPGSIKDTELYRRALQAYKVSFKEELKKSKMSVFDEVLYYLKTGTEWYIVINDLDMKVKEKCIFYEETHPLGRFFDMDVYTEPLASMSRVNFGKKPRKCIICSDSAHGCSRSQKHSLESLITAINSSIVHYLRGE